MADQLLRRSTSAPVQGQIWERQDGSRVRVQGFSKIDAGWVKVREVGGRRERSSYPPTAFANGSFVRVA